MPDRNSIHAVQYILVFCFNALDVKFDFLSLYQLGREEAVVLTPAFQTVGAPKPVGPRAAETQTATKAAPRSYKASCGKIV